VGEEARGAPHQHAAARPHDRSRVRGLGRGRRFEREIRGAVWKLVNREQRPKLSLAGAGHRL
jgi:hypothetical protein